MANPARTCVGCRAVDEKVRLVRCVADAAGRLLPDVKGRLPGRGAWLHRDRGCAEQAIKRGAFARSFRRRLVPLDVEELWRRVAGTGTNVLSNLIRETKEA